MSAWFGALLLAAGTTVVGAGALRARAFRAGWFERAGTTDRTRGRRRPTHGGALAGAAILLAAVVGGVGEPVPRATAAAVGVALLTGLANEHRLRPGWLHAGRVAAALALPAAGLRAELTGTVASDVLLTAAGALVLVVGLDRLDRTDGTMPLVAGILGAGALVAAVRAGDAGTASVAAGVAGAGLGLAGQALPPGRILAGRTGPGVLGTGLAAALVGLRPDASAPVAAAVPLLVGAVPFVAFLLPGLGLRLAGRGLRPSTLLGAAAAAGALGAGLLDRGVGPVALGAAVALVPAGLLALLGAASPRPEGLAPRPRWAVPAVAAGALALVAVAGVAGAAAVAARDDVLAGREHAEAGLAAARGGDLVAAELAFAEADARFGSAAGRLASPAVAVAERTVPGVAQNLRAASALIDAGRDLAGTAAAVADRAGAEDLQVLDGRVPIDAAESVAGDLAAARAVLAATRDRLAALDSPWLVAEAREAADALADEVAAADASIEVAAETTRLLPALLGGDGPRRWFVAVLSSSELRGAGGLLGNYAVLTADAGRIGLERAAGIAELNASTAASSSPEEVAALLPAVYRDQYRSWSPERFWQNLSVTPDVPTMGAAVVAVAPRSAAGAVDGVIGIDPLGVAALARLTGPITVPSWPGPIAPDELADVLLFEQYEALADDAAIDRFQTEVVEAIVDGLTDGALPAPSELVATLAPAVAGGHLRLFSPQADEQGLFARIGADGALGPGGPGDFLQVVSQNGSESKIDHFLRRRVEYDLVRDPATGASTATVTVTLTNLAPATGLGSYVIGGRDASAVTAAGEMRCFTSVVSPMAVESVSVDGGPSRPAQLGSEQGLFTGTVLHRIPPGASSTLVFELAGRLPSGAAYELVVGRQPTAHRDELVVRAGGEAVDVDQHEPFHLAPGNG